MVLLFSLCFTILGAAQSSKASDNNDKTPQNVYFKETPLKEAVTALCKTLKVNLIFDYAVKDSKLSIEGVINFKRVPPQRSLTSG
jgi:hypothetical protein